MIIVGHSSQPSHTEFIVSQPSGRYSRNELLVNASIISLQFLQLWVLILLLLRK